MNNFLLHTCCAPCSIAIIDELYQKFDLTVFFYNPNIFPEAEYLKRKKEVVRVCKKWQIKMVDMDYEIEEWNKKVKGLEKEPEMGARCPVCFKMRLEKTAEFAKENGYKIFGTSLTSGKNKKADIINPIGKSLEEKYEVKYYEEDWKKNGRQEKGRKLVNDMKIYRQDYCGCKYSRLSPPYEAGY
jgi:predicted adenine nucleotide alpha hydrolase (AANH) superfamily ATPase